MRSQLGSRPTPPAFIIGPVIVVLLLANAGVVLARGGDDPAASATPIASVAPTPTAPPEPAPPPPGPGVVLTDPPVGPIPAPAPSPTLTPDPVPEGPVGVGTCFDGAAPTVGEVTPVPCEGPHGNEIYLLREVPGDATAPYPGEEQLMESAGELCRGQAFNDYVGIVWADSRLFTSPIVPTPESWAAGDRMIACLLYDLQGPRTTTARGAAV